MAVLLLLAVAAALIVHRLLPGQTEPAPIEPIPAESTPTVSFVGSFPRAGEETLRNPLGIAERDGAVCVAESDAGRVQVFGLDGRRRTLVDIPPAEGTAASYPADLAFVAEKTIVVVDTAGVRVLLVELDKSPVRVSQFGSPVGGARLGQPTAVATGPDRVFVADASDRNVHVFSPGGKALYTVKPQVEPEIEFVAGMTLVRDTLYLSDSSGRRVLGVDARTGEARVEFADDFSLPRGLDSSDDGAVFVVDAFARSLVECKSGNLSTTLVGEEDSQLPEDALPTKPADVAWVQGANVRLYVSDSADGVIRVYRLRTIE